MNVLDIPPCPPPGEGVHGWMLGAANRCAWSGLPKAQAEPLILSRMTRHPSPKNEVRDTVAKAYCETEEKRKTPPADLHWEGQYPAADRCFVDEKERARRQRIAARKLWPDLVPPSREQLASIADQFTVAEASVELLAHRGLLRAYESSQGPAWVICDSGLHIARARRFDGLPWGSGDLEAIFPNSDPWPVGIPQDPAAPVFLAPGQSGLIYLSHLSGASSAALSRKPLSSP